MKPLQKKAFTLVELLVVISIIALLLAILMPSLNKARESAIKTTCKSNIKQIGLGLYMYVSDFRVMPDGRPAPSGFERHLYRVYTDGTFAGTVGLGVLYPKYIQDPFVFWCPANRQKYDGYSVPQMVESLRKGVSGETTSSEPAPGSYFYRKKAKPSDETTPYIYQMSNSSRFAMIADAAYSDISPPNHKDGYDFAFFDTHVEWVADRGNKLFLQNYPFDFKKWQKWSIDKFFKNGDGIDYISR
ncbi:MAG: DUF1559 family PulG-like putative transporter [Sedimentisphaerales bacterium]